MNAVLAMETVMTAEDRIRDLEHAVKGVQSDVIEIKADVKALTAAYATVPTEMEKRFGAVGSEFGSVRTESANFRAEMKEALGAMRLDMEKGFGAMRVEMEKGFGAMRTEMKDALGAMRADMEKGFGILQTSIEKTNTSIEKAKLWMLVTGVGAVILAALGHIFKVF